jgi:hypothetical protein
MQMQVQTSHLSTPPLHALTQLPGLTITVPPTALPPVSVVRVPARAPGDPLPYTALPPAVQNEMRAFANHPSLRLLDDGTAPSPAVLSVEHIRKATQPEHALYFARTDPAGLLAYAMEGAPERIEVEGRPISRVLYEDGGVRLTYVAEPRLARSHRGEWEARGVHERLVVEHPQKHAYRWMLLADVERPSPNPLLRFRPGFERDGDLPSEREAFRRAVVILGQDFAPLRTMMLAIPRPTIDARIRVPADLRNSMIDGVAMWRNGQRATQRITPILYGVGHPPELQLAH